MIYSSNDFYFDERMNIVDVLSLSFTNFHMS